MSIQRQAFACALAVCAAHAVNAQATPATRAQLTVSSAWLSEHLRDPDLVLLHVGDKGEYEKSHIPGARYVQMQDVSNSSMDHDKGLMLELMSADTLRTRLEKLGISDNSRIVVYFGNDWISPSTRILLTLDHAGFGTRSSLLDGGMKAWIADGRSVTADATPAKAGQLSALKTRPVTVDINYVQSHLKAPGFKIIDARAPVFYDGVEMGSPPRKGHVAGATNIPFTSVTDEKGKLKSNEELAALFAKAGVGPKDTVIAYCHIGQQGTAVVFAARALGHPVVLFDGSYQEWSRRLDLPVENPAEGRK